ncbi:MAG: SDR family oxidoreductase, partial [Acidimicrobiales bacterium]
MSEHKVAVVTGGSAGVGRATAVALANDGWDVAVLARGQAGLDGAVAEIEAAGRRGLGIPTDVADFVAVEHAARRIEDQLGPIELWVNDAMTTAFAPIWEIEPADFQRAVEVTFLGQVWGTRVAVDLMRPRDRGTIINIGSALAFIGIPLQSAYCASKFACRGFFESVRAELLHEGSNVTMSMVHLPAMNTPQFDWCETTMNHHPQPVPPIYEPDVAAQRILKVLADGRRDTILGSWNKVLVTAGKLAPNLGNQYASIGAWDTQLTDEQVDADRPSNLRHPVDADQDHGPRGSFDDKSGGFWDPSFLKS